MGADYITIRSMSYSRRSFMKWAATVSALAATDGARASLGARAFQASGSAFQPALLPSQHDVWEQQLWMAKLGPKYTGNKAHDVRGVSRDRVREDRLRRGARTL